MYQSVSLGNIAVKEKDFEKKLLLAKKHGFKYMEAGAPEIMEVGVETVKALLEKHEMGISSCGLPFHPVEVSEAEFEKAMEVFPAQAAALEAVGCTRCIIWIFPASDTLTKEENYALHAARLSAVARVLKEHGIRLGLEFIGPYPMRKDKKVFIYTAEEMLELARDCGDNVGLLFDIYHWHTGANNRDVFDHITDEKDIVLVHVNDAAFGDTLELPDSPRMLPGETGVIDAAFIMQGLRKIGYTGPVVAEPFSTKLPEMESDDARVACVKACMDKIMAE